MTQYTKIVDSDLAATALYDKVNNMVDALNSDKVERSQLGLRKANTAYAVGAVCYCEYHPEFVLKCTTAGVTSGSPLDTSGVITDKQVINDGGVVWTVGKNGGTTNVSNFTNCITEIPQNIKLELNNGTLTIKSGSVITYPDGTQVTKSTDTTVTTAGTGVYFFVRLLTTGAIGYYSHVFSGSTAPSGHTNMLWYDTTNNDVKDTTDGGNTWRSGWSLPFAICTAQSGWKSIDQVFNGFGYIGSTVFALPGVKGLMPNGRNSDGSLKNIEFVTNRVVTRTDNNNVNPYLAIDLDYGTISIAPSVEYDEKNNEIIWAGNRVRNRFYFGEKYTSGNTFSKFITKQPFHAVDYNDYRELKETILGSDGKIPEDRIVKQTTLSSSSTDNQVPSAKCVYDLVGNVEALINAL